MNTRQAAEALGTDSKRLRRFLRADPTYRNAGQGGRYEFAEKDLTTLKKRFDAWVVKTAKSEPTRAPRRRGNREIPAMDESILGRALTSTEREERDKRSRERVDRLEERLRAAGLHVSQARDRTRS